jgi:transcription-repair coupling factor (superfamily II helicase)
LKPGQITISGVPEGVDALHLGRLASEPNAPLLVYVARDDSAAARMIEFLTFFAPNVTVLDFPAWDCLPYDRVSPNVDVVARRIDTLTRLVNTTKGVVVTSISAMLQRIPPRKMFEKASFHAKVGGSTDVKNMLAFLDGNGIPEPKRLWSPANLLCAGGSSTCTRLDRVIRCAWTSLATKSKASAPSIH